MSQKVGLILGICALWGSLASAAIRQTGWDNGNAGDIYGSEFSLTGLDLVSRLELLPKVAIAGLNTDTLNAVVHTTTLRSQEQVLLNGQEVDAKNYPDQKLILINRERWRDYRAPDQTKNRFLLVLHEYLFIVGTDDTNFVFSNRLISLLQIDNYSPDHWWNPLNPTNSLSAELVYNPSKCKIPLFTFNPAVANESFTKETGTDCGSEYRRIEIDKTSASAPPESGYQGVFHRFDVSVFDKDGKVLGMFTYTPEWGRCVLPQDGNCQLSGQLQSGGINFAFWFLRN